METDSNTPPPAATTTRRMNRGSKPAAPSTTEKPTAPAADIPAPATTEKPPAPDEAGSATTTATAGEAPAITQAPAALATTATTPADTQSPAAAPAQSAPTEAPAPASSMAAKLAGMGVPGLSFTTAESVDLSAMKIMSLLYGDSGAGKTHFACMAEDVVVALLDTQGFATIRSANPAAVVAGTPDPSAQSQPRLKNMGEVREFFKAVAGGKLAAAGVKTIVVDHITELQQMMIDEIIADKRVRTAPTSQVKVVGQPTQAPPPQAKGPAPEMTKQDWGILATKMRNFLRMLRGLPHHVIVLALAAPSTDEATGRRMTFPALSGSAKDSLPSYFNLVGYIYKTTIDGVTQRVVMLDGDDRYYSKSYGPLRGIVQADVRLWQRLLAGGEGAVHAVGAKPPGGAVASGKPRIGTTEAPAASTEDTGGDSY